MNNGVMGDRTHLFDNRRILITGGTGSLGKALVRRLLGGSCGRPDTVIVLSRDEAKQHDMRLYFHHLSVASEDIIYRDYQEILRFRIGDIRDFSTVSRCLRSVDIVFNAAALKQVPTCEYFPTEAVATNVLGPRNIVEAIERFDLPVEAVIGISTDKACKPVNAMGMTKALQERILISSNICSPGTRFVSARYGNVLASRGSIIPLFHSQINNGGPVTLTTPEMTRFLLSLEKAVETVIDTYHIAGRGEIVVPRVPSANIKVLAQCLIGERPIELREIGMRPGEKIHEILVAEDEACRTVDRRGYYVIRPALPELHGPDDDGERVIRDEYSSALHVLGKEQVREILQQNGLTVEQRPDFSALY